MAIAILDKREYAHTPAQDRGHVRTDFVLAKPEFNGGLPLANEKPVIGRLPFQEPADGIGRYPTVRLKYWQGEDRCVSYSHHLSKFVVKDEKELKFKFTPPQVKSGPVLFIFDIVEYPDAERAGIPATISPPYAMVVDVVAGTGAPTGLPNATESPVPGKEDFKILSATELTPAFLDNKAAAEKKYGNCSQVAVRGVVQEVKVSTNGKRRSA